MKQAVLTEQGFQIREVPRPALSSGKALIRMLSDGVCGGDIGTFKNIEARRGKEIWLGHEASGVIVEKDSLVTNFNVGDAVTVLGGRYAEYVLADSNALVKLPDGVDPRWALGEPVACCVHAMNRSKIKSGDRVAVIGCGVMGLICLQLTKILGAGHIAAIDPIDERLQMARRFGAAETINAAEITIEKLRAKYGDFNGDADVVVEATGIQTGIDVSGYLVRQHGLINLVGHHFSNNGRRTVFMDQWNVKAIDVVNGHVRRDDEKLAAMRQGMELAARGKLLLAPMITPYPLSRIQEAFEDTVHYKKGLIKAVIVPDEN